MSCVAEANPVIQKKASESEKKLGIGSEKATMPRAAIIRNSIVMTQ